jgi:hypothetical protein
MFRSLLLNANRSNTGTVFGQCFRVMNESFTLRSFSAKSKPKRTVDVILVDDVDKLGIKGQQIAVRKGYARNFLFPLKKCVPFTEQSREAIPPPSVSAESFPSSFSLSFSY